MQTGLAAVRAQGFAAAVRRFGATSFFDLIDETSSVWNQLVVRGIAPGGPVNAMIPDAQIQFLPLVNASPEALRQRRFRIAIETAHYTLWVRTVKP